MHTVDRRYRPLLVCRTDDDRSRGNRQMSTKTICQSIQKPKHHSINSQPNPTDFNSKSSPRHCMKNNSSIIQTFGKLTNFTINDKILERAKLECLMCEMPAFNLESICAIYKLM